MMACPFTDPIDAILAQDGTCVLAIIVAVQGPSYRPVGSMLAVFSSGERVGHLSSGCVEDDIVIHALAAIDAGKPVTVRYGLDSPFMDIKLPCGGGIEILLLPQPDRTVLQKISDARAARIDCSLKIDPITGQLSMLKNSDSGWNNDQFCVHFSPEIKFAVFGAGQEAAAFCSLVQSAGYPNVLYSPNDEVLDYCRYHGVEAHKMISRKFPASLTPDGRTAIVLFFHDHDWEPQILATALTGPAFYVGAQGSERVAEIRRKTLSQLGLESETISRLNGPFGLVRPARDARTLAVSVLAEVLGQSAEMNASAK